MWTFGFAMICQLIGLHYAFVAGKERALGHETDELIAIVISLFFGLAPLAIAVFCA